VQLLERRRDIGEEVEQLRKYRTKEVFACLSFCVSKVEVIEQMRDMMALGVISEPRNNGGAALI
jgi:hypothetical protein